jgi:hypothetical protein
VLFLKEKKITSKMATQVTPTTSHEQAASGRLTLAPTKGKRPAEKVRLVREKKTTI